MQRASMCHVRIVHVTLAAWRFEMRLDEIDAVYVPSQNVYAMEQS